MESFLSDLVKQCGEKLINRAIAEARHVLCFTCIVKEFEKERARLEPARRTIEQRVKVAKERDKDIQANVVSWAEEIDELNQVDTKTKQTCFFGFCPDCIWRYKKGKELTDKVKRINELKLEKFENIELPRHVPGIERHSSKDYISCKSRVKIQRTVGCAKNIKLSHCLPGVERYSLKDYISFESREKKYKELSDALKDDNNYITGLHGMGGTGKTTLAIKVGKDLKQSEQFAYVVDTIVSFTPDLKKIQDEIAGSLGLKWEDCNESDRHKKLSSRLINGDKILVILDDVWDQDHPLNFDAIGIPEQGNHKGFRVLVTSRSKETFKNMGCGMIIALDLLTEKEAWNMFERYAEICNTTSRKLIDMGRKIAKECKQLPIAISVIARSLKGQESREYKWDVALKSLKQHVYKDCVDENTAVIHNCLKISYDHLMDKKLKGLFLLCSVFREDEEISIEVLTRLCIGVRFFGEDCQYYNDARNEVVEAKDKLVDSCLLLEVDAKRVKMHDMVREAAQGIANKEIQCVKLFDKKQKSLVEKQTNIKHLLCEGKCMDFFNLKFDGSKLETLIVEVDEEDRECIEIPNSFLENDIKLRVLYFSGNDHQTLSLPPLFRLLTNIRSMSVNEVDLGDISILGSLESLETLELVRCKINELPNQITELKKFKLLKLSGCDIEMNNPFEVIKRCASLEELYFKYSFNDFCQEITFPELQRYHIKSNRGCYLERTKISKYVAFYGNEECQLSEETLKYCLQTAEALSLDGIEGEWRNLMPKMVSVEHGMNHLVELHLSEISQLQCLIDTIGSQVPNVLSNLVDISIVECIHLQSLFKGNLKTILLCNCPELVSLFEVSTSRSLVLLETLEIHDCEGLETIIAYERIEDEEIDDGGNSKSYGSVFSKLKVIDIKECRRLEYILPFLSAQDLPALESIRIRKCDGLKYVFGKSQHAELVSLSELKLSKLPHFIGIFEECNHLMSSCVKGSSSTSNYGSKAEIQFDPIKSNTFSWWTHICCHTTIPLVDDVDGDQLHDNAVATDGQQLDLGLQKIVLFDLPMMTCLFGE